MQGKNTFSVHSLQSTDSNRIHDWTSWEYHRKRVRGGMEQYKNPDSLGRNFRGENVALVDNIRCPVSIACLWALLTLGCVVLVLYGKTPANFLYEIAHQTCQHLLLSHHNPLVHIVAELRVAMDNVLYHEA